MEQRKYQIQRRPAHDKSAPMQNYLRPFNDLLEAAHRLELESEKHLGYEWKIMPIKFAQKLNKEIESCNS